MGGTGAGGGSGAALPIACVIFSSNRLRGPGCKAMAMNRESTSSEADSDAAMDCARSIGGKALVGLLLEQAATTSFTAWVKSSLLLCRRSRLSRSARATACSTALGSGDMRRIGGNSGTFPRFCHCETRWVGRQRFGGCAVPNPCLAATAQSVFSAHVELCFPQCSASASYQEHAVTLEPIRPSFCQDLGH